MELSPDVYKNSLRGLQPPPKHFHSTKSGWNNYNLNSRAAVSYFYFPALPPLLFSNGPMKRDSLQTLNPLPLLRGGGRVGEELVTWMHNAVDLLLELIPFHQQLANGFPWKVMVISASAMGSVFAEQHSSLLNWTQISQCSSSVVMVEIHVQENLN